MAMLPVNDLGGELVNPYPEISPMLTASGDPELDMIRQKQFAQNTAMQNNQVAPQLSMPSAPMLQDPPETMTMPQANTMLTQGAKPPDSILQAAMSQFMAEPGQTPFSDYAKANWQDLLKSGVAGLEDQSMRANLPADIYIKMKAQENDKIIADQDRLLKNLQMQSDVEYQRQSLELKREELAMERQRVLMGDRKPTALMQNYDFIREMMPNANPVEILPYASGSGLSGGVSYDPNTGAVTKPAKPMPASAIALQNKYAEDLAVAQGTQQNVDKFVSQIESGKLDFGYFSNLYNKGKNLVGMSDEESRNLSSFQSSLEKMRNDSLRLNAGVQTDGDAQRAWNELFQSLNDPDLVKQRLSEIKEINNRGAMLKKLQIDSLRENYGQPEYDYSKVEALPSLDNSGGLAPDGVDPSLLEFMSPEERALFQ
jgi:hypothetical protein